MPLSFLQPVPVFILLGLVLALQGAEYRGITGVTAEDADAVGF